MFANVPSSPPKKFLKSPSFCQASFCQVRTQKFFIKLGGIKKDA